MFDTFFSVIASHHSHLLCCTQSSWDCVALRDLRWNMFIMYVLWMSASDEPLVQKRQTTHGVVLSWRHATLLYVVSGPRHFFREIKLFMHLFTCCIFICCWFVRLNSDFPFGCRSHMCFLYASSMEARPGSPTFFGAESWSGVPPLGTDYAPVKICWATQIFWVGTEE